MHTMTLQHIGALMDQATLDIDNKSIVHIIVHEPFHGCVDILNANVFNLTGDVVLGAEVQHLLSLFDAPNRTATNPETACKHHNGAHQKSSMHAGVL